MTFAVDSWALKNNDLSDYTECDYVDCTCVCMRAYALGRHLGFVFTISLSMIMLEFDFVLKFTKRDDYANRKM